MLNTEKVMVVDDINLYTQIFIFVGGLFEECHKINWHLKLQACVILNSEICILEMSTSLTVGFSKVKSVQSSCLQSLNK